MLVASYIMFGRSHLDNSKLGRLVVILVSTEDGCGSKGTIGDGDVNDIMFYTTPDQPSCRFNCDRNMGSCSCSSSCEYYGRCCHDYYQYCYATTTALPSCRFNCGRDMGICSCSSSCEYQVGCCHGYYEYCYSTTYMPTTAQPSCRFNCGRYMGSCSCSSSCRFYGSCCDDYYEYCYSTTDMPSTGKVNCSSDVMNIVIGRKYLNSLGYDGHNIYLNDQNCRPQIFMKEVVFNFRVYSCGTSRKFENGRVVYTNAVRGFTTSYGDVTRKANLKINVVCQMDQYSESQIMYLAQNHDNTSITGTGMFNTSMDFYTSSSFFYKVDEFPYKVSLNQDIYVQVDLSSSISFYMDIFLDTCLASPSPNNFHTTTYYLVRNGCPIDNTYQSYVSGTTRYARFSFKAFQFLRHAEQVYIQCKVIVCKDNDWNSRCRRGCIRRKARDVGAKHKTQTLVLGPIQLIDPDKKEKGSVKEDAA
nr:deleted in malignant brain tumors 1 protein-like [Nerophis lumbriciformis]